MVPAALVAPQGPRTSRARMEQQARWCAPPCVCRGRVLSRCGPLPSGRRPFFFPLLPLPVEGPAKAADSRASATERRPAGPCPLRRRKLRASTAERNGAALHVFCVVSHVTPQRQTPGGTPFPAGRHFFSRSIPCAKMKNPSGKRCGRSSPPAAIPSAGPASWSSSACSAWSAISTTPPGRSCARPSSSAKRGGVHVLQ